MGVPESARVFLQYFLRVLSVDADPTALRRLAGTAWYSCRACAVVSVPSNMFVCMCVLVRVCMCRGAVRAIGDGGRWWWLGPQSGDRVAVLVFVT